MCRAAYENFADFLSAFSSCTNCRNCFKLCSEAVFSLAEPSSLGDGAGGKGATPTITLITLNIGCSPQLEMHKQGIPVQEMSGHGTQCSGLVHRVVKIGLVDPKGLFQPK